MVVDTVTIDTYAEARLARSLGYVLYCRLDGIDADYPVHDINLTGEQLEVKTIQGWRQPQRCWATLDEPVKVSEQPQAEQRGLF